MAKIILTSEQIQEICKRVGKQISDAVREDKKVPLIVGVMKGAINFMVDVMKYIDVPFYTDYIQISSYRGTKRTTTVQLLKDVSYDCQGRSVIIVEDIVDTGYSMKFLIDHFKSHCPKRVYVCTLIDKVNARQVDVPIDFTGFVLEKNRFIIGYGLDYSELERNVPYIYEAEEKDIYHLNKIISQDEESEE